MEMVKKIYFWVLVPILIIVAFIVATMAIGDIKKKFEEKKKAVEAEKQALDGIASDAKHPNDTTIDLIKKETGVLSKSVFEAWALMYSDQKLRNRWPRQLSKEFLGLVENLKFRASIDPTKPYLLEDYSFFIGNHLPSLLKEIQRRRVQIHDYKYVKEEKRFFPVYVDTEKNIYYILITEGESDRVKYVMIYDVRRDLLKKVENSAERDAFISKERKPFYKEMDPWIVTPKEYMTFGLAMNTSGMGGEMGGMDPSMTGGAPGMGAPGMEGAPGGGPGMEGSRGPRGSMGGDGMGLSMSSVSIPGDNIDPALEQLPSNTATGGAGAGAAGVGMDPGMAGVVGAGMGTTGKEISYPGLPPYKERKRIVGNVDWESPEIYTLPTWSKNGYPKSIEIWYAQESLWVYEALIRVIAESNKEAPDNINLAPVKAVEAMLIGQPAGAAWASVKNALGDLTGKSMSADSMMMGSGSEMMSPSAGSATGGTGSEMGNMTATAALTENEILKRILFGRYLDLDNKPLSTETAPPFAEFNKMPICMKLIIDQRRIPDLLVNCANCSMPIDIKHVRICPDNLVPFGNVGGTVGMDAMGGDPGMMGGGAPGGAPPMSGPRGSMGAESGQGAQSISVEVGRSEISQINGYGNDAIRVEIYGIINIFNEPNLSKLGTGNTSEGEKSESSAEATGEGSKNKSGEEEGTPAPANPAGTPAPANPAGTPAPANPAGTPAPANPAGNPAPANPAGTPAPANPS